MVKAGNCPVEQIETGMTRLAKFHNPRLDLVVAKSSASYRTSITIDREIQLIQQNDGKMELPATTFLDFEKTKTGTLKTAIFVGFQVIMDIYS